MPDSIAKTSSERFECHPVQLSAKFSLVYSAFLTRFVGNGQPFRFNRFSPWPPGPDVNPFREELPRVFAAACACYFTFLLLSFFFLISSRRRTPMEVDFPMGSVGVCSCKVEISKLSNRRCRSIRGVGRTANKIDLGCTFCDGDGVQRGGVENARRR